MTTLADQPIAETFAYHGYVVRMKSKPSASGGRLHSADVTAPDGRAVHVGAWFHSRTAAKAAAVDAVKRDDKEA